MSLGRERVRRERGPFLRFCVVGAGGFLLDAGVLAALTWGFGLGLIVSRIVSASIAIAGTFWLNRIWSFSDAEPSPIATAFRKYVAVQGTGFLINVTIYVALIQLTPQRFGNPILALGVASAVALAVNYAGSRLFVFRAADAAGREESR